MVLLMVVVLVAEDALALLALPLEVSSGNESTGMGDESCANVSEGQDEDDS